MFESVHRQQKIHFHTFKFKAHIENKNWLSAGYGNLPERACCDEEAWWLRWREAVHATEESDVRDSTEITRNVYSHSSLHFPYNIHGQHNTYVYLSDMKIIWNILIHLKYVERHQVGMSSSSKYTSIWITVQTIK